MGPTPTTTEPADREERKMQEHTPRNEEHGDDAGRYTVRIAIDHDDGGPIDTVTSRRRFTHHADAEAYTDVIRDGGAEVTAEVIDANTGEAVPDDPDQPDQPDDEACYGLESFELVSAGRDLAAVWIQDLDTGEEYEADMHVRYIHAERGLLAFIMEGPVEQDPLGYTPNIIAGDESTTGDLKNNEQILTALTAYLNS